MSSTLELMKQQAEGLRMQLEKHRADERSLQRAAGLQVQLEKDHTQAIELAEKLDDQKNMLRFLQEKKAESIQRTTEAISARMNTILGTGNAVFEITDEGGVFLGWDMPNRGRIAYGGLSGGQRVLFESALANALVPAGKTNAIIMIEAAELGSEIATLLAGVSQTTPQAQILACTCHHVATCPPDWQLTEVAV